MELTGYVEALQGQLAVAAAAAGKEGVEMAERLTGTLDAAARRRRPDRTDGRRCT